jgi:hypothetical protein
MNGQKMTYNGFMKIILIGIVKKVG